MAELYHILYTCDDAHLSKLYQKINYFITKIKIFSNFEK